VETLKSHGRQPPIFQESYIEKNGVGQHVRKLSLWKFREHIVPRFDDGVACSAALGIVILRWLIGSIGRPKAIGSSLILEGAISPSAAVLTVSKFNMAASKLSMKRADDKVTGDAMLR
jgi:hypothetical protein